MQYTAAANVDISIQEVSVKLDVSEYQLAQGGSELYPVESSQTAVVNPYIYQESASLNLLPPRFVPTTFVVDTTKLVYSGYDYVDWFDGEILFDGVGESEDHHPAFTHWIPTATPASGSTVISSSNKQYTLPTVEGGVYNFTVDWGDGSSDEITSWDQAEITHTYATGGQYEINITGVFEGANFHRNEATGHMDCVKLIETKSWGTGFFIDIASYVPIHSPNAMSLNTGGVWDGCINWYDTSEVAPIFKKCGTASTHAPNGAGRTFVGDDVKPFRGTNSLDSDLSHWTTPTERFSGSMYLHGRSRAAKPGVNFRHNWRFDVTSADGLEGAIENFRRVPSPESTSVNLGTSYQNVHPSAQNFDVTLFNPPEYSYSLKSFATAANSFDGDTSGLVTSYCTNLYGVFAKNPSFTGRGVQTWNTSSCTNFSTAFNDCYTFNAYIGHFKFAPGSSATSMLQAAKEFNQPCSDWGDEVKNIANSLRMFKEAFAFNNGDVTNNGLVPWTNAHWKTCVTFYEMFRDSNFNQDVSKWILPNSTDVPGGFSAQAMFYGTPFNQPVDTHEEGGIKYWDMSNCTNISAMFNNARSFNQPLNNWDTSNVTTMAETFRFALEFDQDLNNWDTSNVTTMNNMFSSDNIDSAFNGDVTTWDTSNVTSMRSMFRSCRKFNQDIGSWDTSNVTDISNMFYRNDDFNYNLNSWNTSKVEDMRATFRQATSFNQPLNNWDTSNVTSMAYTFFTASAFNQPIPTDGNKWNTGQVTTMEGMFENAASFNQDLSSWDVSNVTDMGYMFNSADLFEGQGLDAWDVSSVTNMDRMFYAAGSFNQDLSSWNIASVSSIDLIFYLSGMSKTNLDATIQGWCNKASTPSGLDLGEIPLNGTTETLDPATTDLMDDKGMTATYTNGNPVY